MNRFFPSLDHTLIGGCKIGLKDMTVTYLIGHRRRCWMVAGRRMCVLVTNWWGRHLVVALWTGTRLIWALRGGGCIGGVLLCIIPTNTDKIGTHIKMLQSLETESNLWTSEAELCVSTHIAGVPGVCGLYWGLTCGDGTSGYPGVWGLGVPP